MIKTRILRWRELLLVTLSIFATIPSQGKPCFCNEITDIKQHFKQAEIVITATLIKQFPNAQPDYTTTMPDGSQKTVSYIFGHPKLIKVNRVYKGRRLSEEMIIKAEVSNCEVRMTAGKTYLIIAQKDGTMLRTSRCSGTGLLEGHFMREFLQAKKYKKPKSSRNPISR